MAAVTRIEGTATLNTGATVQFIADAEDGIIRWGGPARDLGDTVDVTEVILDALTKGLDT